MSYNPIKWINGSTPLSAQNLNHMEQGIKDNEDLVTKTLTTSMVPSANTIQDIFKTEDTFIAPDNGYIGITFLHKYGDTGLLSIYAVTSSFDMRVTAYNSYEWSSGIMPVKKGDTIRFGFANGSRNDCDKFFSYFVYSIKVV